MDKVIQLRSKFEVGDYVQVHGLPTFDPTISYKIEYVVTTLGGETICCLEGTPYNTGSDRGIKGFNNIGRWWVHQYLLKPGMPG